jgi:hypothetical protein
MNYILLFSFMLILFINIFTIVWVYQLDKKIVEIVQHLRELYKKIR